MSETQTVVQQEKQNAGENTATNESRRGSQSITSPIKQIFSRAQSLTQRSLKSNRNSIAQDENEDGNGNNTISAIGPGNETISKLLDNAYDPESPQKEDNIPDKEAQEQDNIGVKIHQLQQSSPIRQGKTQQIVLDDGHTISVRIEGESSQPGFFGSPQRRQRRVTGESGSTASNIHRKHRRQTSVERELQQRIDRENRILLRKILEQHHGVRRSSAIPPPPRHPTRKKFPESREVTLQKYRNKPTSNQLNQQRWKHKTDYENLLLLQKIQNAKPSKDIEQSFQKMKL